MNRLTILLVLLGTVACGKDEGAAPPPVPGADPAPEVPPTAAKTPEQLAIEKESAQPVTPRAGATRSNNDIDLTFSGAFTARLQGKGGLCTLRKRGPMPGTTWQVRSDELGVRTPTFDLTILSETASFDDPAIIVNQSGEGRASFARHRGKPDAKLVVAHDATAAELDIVLENVDSHAAELHVVGSIRCPTPAIFQ
jgi:hypothetical protein